MDREMLGRFIAQRRKELNLTQRELAEKLHVTDKAVSKWERGAGCPDISLLEPLAEALGLSVDQLLTYQTAAAEAESEPTPTSEAVQAVLDLTLAQRRARRMRRWLIGLAVPLGLILLAVLYMVLHNLQVQGGLFHGESSTSPNGSITVTTYGGDFGQQTVTVKKPDPLLFEDREGNISHGMSRSYRDTTFTDFLWSPDSAYLAFGQRETGETPRLDCSVWYFYQDAGGQWYGKIVYGTLRTQLAYLWHEGDEMLKAALPAVPTAQPSGYPVFDVTIDSWDGDVLQVNCTYSGTDSVDYKVTVRYDVAADKVLSAE